MNPHPFFNGAHLRACRILAGLDQTVAARLAKISDRAIRYWEAKSRLPSSGGYVLDQLAEVIRAHGVEITERGCALVPKPVVRLGVKSTPTAKTPTVVNTFPKTVSATLLKKPAPQ